ncbi:MAG: hypothetical protein Q4B34_01315 [Candidatus Saccharibacteria bacterium]|nr:hypothetical protein [Candidatus Saccharibacteria bacterium]
MKRYEEVQKDGEFIIRLKGLRNESKKSFWQRLSNIILGEGKPLRILWRLHEQEEMLDKTESGIFNVQKYLGERGFKSENYGVIHPNSVSWHNLIPNKQSVLRAYAEFRVKESFERDPSKNVPLTYCSPHMQFMNEWRAIAKGKNPDWALSEVGISGIWVRTRFTHLSSGEVADLILTDLDDREIEFCITSGEGYDGLNRSYRIQVVRKRIHAIDISEYYATKPKRYLFVPPDELGELYPGANEDYFTIVGAHNLLFGGKWERVP